MENVVNFRKFRFSFLLALVFAGGLENAWALDFAACSDDRGAWGHSSYKFSRQGELSPGKDRVLVSNDQTQIVEREDGELITTFVLSRERSGKNLRPKSLEISWPAGDSAGSRIMVTKEFSYGPKGCFVSREWSQSKREGDRENRGLATIDFDFPFCSKVIERCGAAACSAKEVPMVGDLYEKQQQSFSKENKTFPPGLWGKNSSAESNAEAIRGWCQERLSSYAKLPVPAPKADSPQSATGNVTPAR